VEELKRTGKKRAFEFQQTFMHHTIPNPAMAKINGIRLGRVSLANA
jgi:hypothetical protein